MPNKNDDRNEGRYTPVKRYAFPAGDGGGEIRITIPTYASKADIEMLAAALGAIAAKWKEIE